MVVEKVVEKEVVIIKDLYIVQMVESEAQYYC